MSLQDLATSLNRLILSIFAKDARFSNHIDSVRRRFQTLTLIYMSISLIGLLTVFTLIVRISFGSENAYLIVLCALPLFFLTFFWISRRKLDFAATTLVIIFHLCSKFASDLLGLPVMSLTGIMLYPYILLSLTSSLKIFFLNVILCFGQFFYNAKKLNLIFAETINEEQNRQILALMYYVLLIFISVCFLSIFQKVTEAHLGSLAQSNFEKSEKLTEEVVQAMEAKDTFISMISHEIRNPLNALKISIDYLLQIAKDQAEIKILKNAKLGGEVLLNLVSNVLDAAKLKSDKMEIVCMETDFVGVVEKALTINSEPLKEKEIFAKALIKKDLPEFLWIDQSRLLQILMNLISNAIKFTPKKGKIDIYVSWLAMTERESLLKPFLEIGENPQRSRPSLMRDVGTQAHIEEMSFNESESFNRNIQSISQYKCNLNDVSPSNIWRETLRSNPWEILKVNQFKKSNESQQRMETLNQRRAGYLKVQIQDTGCGIAENQIPRLFGMFEQSREHSRMASGGTGLGLWVCKQLLQKMNGDITVYSKQGKGTSFVFYLPVQNNQARVPDVIRPSRSLLKTMRALVVDDYPTNRYMHKLFLEEQGVQVTVASDGKEAVERYKKQGPDYYNFIMMDVQMPVMDGFTAAKQIRQWDEANSQSKIPIYFVTGEYFSEEDVLRIFKNKGGSIQSVRCLKKPLETEIIKKIVIDLK